jgi:O-antigen/teichoic acid export membrane protein
MGKAGAQKQYVFLRKFLSEGSVKYLSDIAYLLSSILLSRYISPAEYGIYGLAVIAYNLLQKYTDLGVTEAIIREPYRKELRVAAYSLSVVKGLIAALLLCLASYLVGLFFQQAIVSRIGIILAISIVIKSFTAITVALARKNGNFQKLYRLDLTAALVSIVISVVLAVRGFGPYALLAPPLLSALLYLMVFSPSGKPNISSIRHEWPQLGSLFRNVGIITSVRYARQNIDSVFIARFFSTAVLGVYNRAYSVIYTPSNLLLSQLNYFLYRVLPETKPDKKAIVDVQLLASLITLTLLPFIWIFSLLGTELSVFLWGQDWAAVGVFLAILCPVALTQPLMAGSQSILLYYKQEQSYSRLTLISTVSLLILVSAAALHSSEAIALAYAANCIAITLPLYLVYSVGKLDKRYLYSVAPAILFPITILAGNYVGNLVIQLIALSAASLYYGWEVLTNFSRYKELFRA